MLIPLVVLARNPKQPIFLRPVIIYLCLAFIINLSGDIISDFAIYLPDWIDGNNVLYNIHSIMRFVCFSYFFSFLKQPHFAILKKILPYLSVVLIIINFTFFEYFFNHDHISGNLLAAEALLLLIYCLQYYLSKMKDEKDVLTSSKDFLVVTGISIYVVINFFVFLFYVPMITENPELADNMWGVHNVAYLILCVLIAKAFSRPIRNKEGNSTGSPE